MLIFQCNQPMDGETHARWDAYLRERTENDEAILLPSTIDFKCIADKMEVGFDGDMGDTEMWEDEETE